MNTSSPVPKRSPDNSTTIVRSSSSFKTRLKSIAFPLLLGQLLAVFIGATAICSNLLAKSGTSLPLTQNLLHYGLLALCFGCIRLFYCFRQTDGALCDPNSSLLQPRRFGAYVVAGMIDVHANWAIVSAYKFTSVTSVQLLDCVTIPAAMLFSYFFMHHRYLWTHYGAMFVCLAGAGGMIAADVWANPAPSPSSPALINGTDGNTTINNNSTSGITPSSIALGDFLVIAGAVAYAASNVFQQYLVIQYGVVDYLSYSGLTAFLCTLGYSMALELDGIQQLLRGGHEQNHMLIGACFAGYVTAMFLLYTTMPYVLARTNAVLVNLSLLTADVYALLMGIYLFHNNFHVLYVLCFVVILFGVGLFSAKQPVTKTINASSGEDGTEVSPDISNC